MNSPHSTMPATPRARYEADIAAGLITADPAQARAVLELERVFQALANGPAKPSSGLFERLRGQRQQIWVPVRGLYLWGPVGRGKTYLVDTFFDCLAFPQKSRVHFHSFMRRTHDALKRLRQVADPLQTVARRWAGEHRVLCLDEFHVADITDAMLLANLLDALLADGVTIVATSNEAPGELYSGGLQRERFLPAIALMERELEVCELAGAVDYRLRALEQAPVFYRCAAGECTDALERSFRAVTGGAAATTSAIIVEGRPIPTVRRADGVVWFDFAVLCGGPRSAVDYIEIARCYHTLLIADVPRFGADDSDAARRFINLIDELYDRNVNLILSAAAEPEELYAGSRLLKPFLRTASRLREMRSHDYLARPHVSD